MNSLQKALFVNTRQHEAGLIQSLRPLGGGADTHRREGLTDAGEEATFLRQRAAVRYHSEGIHLQAVIVMETQGFLADHPLVKRKAGSLQPIAAAGMAGIEDGHIIFFRHGIDGGKQRSKILFGVDILLPMGR